MSEKVEEAKAESGGEAGGAAAEEKKPAVAARSPFKYKEMMCSMCGNEVAAFMSDPCRCFTVCKKCAMKMATGGKCKVCGQMYGGFKLIIPGKAPAPEPDDD